ncbi:PorP/SprF family type IX secretion system membrane protein [Aquimarina sp. SS2-1]|uniref:PorP/SprF family type IX secretion system membrane protein n=1 Tax=Aquimarina besae TaxID=3342247 RepID=UPI0036723A29
MIKKILFIILCSTCLNLIYSQETTPITSQALPVEVPLHNSIKYNRFLFNPTFSLVRENKNSVNVYNRNERISFQDNPQTYVLNYNARFDEKTGIGIGLYQQSLGVLRYFGGTLNYAYNLELNRDMNFTFGVNLQYLQSSLKSKLDQAQISDPITDNFESSSVFLLKPGVNFNYGNFDVGVAVGNLVAYNITASELLTDNFEYLGHVMYTTELDWRTDNELRGMVYASKPGELDLRYGGNVLFEIPKYGWAQLGYNSFYGGAIGVGANISKVVSVGLSVEPGIGGSGTTAEFGSSWEVALAYNFGQEEKRKKRRNFSSKSSLQRDSEIRRLKKEILDQNKIIRELQNSRGDSLTEAQRSMNKLERSIQEAKEEEARKARQLALQREEEVKLLNKQREELAAQKQLELEMAEQKAEEERLAAEKRLALEMQEQKNAEEAAGRQAEEARIAAEEAAREAEAEQQEAAAEAEAEAKRQEQEAIRLAEQEAETERQQIAAAEEAKKQAEAEALRQEEERLAAQKQLELEMAEQKAEEERLAAQKKLELEMAEQKAEEERLASQKKLEREIEEQRRIEESQKTLEREVSVQKDEEAEAARLAEEERLRQEAEAARLAEEERLRQEAEAARLAEEERQRQEAEAARLAEEERLRQEAEAARLAEEERLRQEAEAARLAEEERLRQEAEAARLAEEERLRQEAEAARLAEEERLRQEAEAARLAEEERLRQEAEAARLAEEERLRQEAEAARLAEEERLRQEAEAARLAEEERQRQEAEAARLAEEERLRQEAEASRLAEQERLRQEAEAVRLAEEERQRQEAEAARLAEEERQRQEAEAARLAEEERQRQEAEAASEESSEDLEEIQKELENSSRITDRLIASRDSLLTSSVNLDKREFNKLLESLVNMNNEAEEVKNSNDPTSSKRLTSKNRFIKFAEATRPEAKYATKFIPGYPEGFYLIGNVFRGGTYAESFTNKLKDLGFNDAQIILNPENQYQYVAIEYYDNKTDAAENYLNNIGNKYFGDMWILNIAKNRVESLKRLVQETRLIKDTVKDDTVLTESLSYIGGHNIENGYYLITNIFKRENYFERGMDRLKSQGLEPKFFRNPKDNYIYVYLDRFDTLDQAKQSLFSNVGNTYNGDLYILKIQ